MGIFKNDFSDAQKAVGFSQKPEGDYEVIVMSAEEKTFKTGTVGLNFKFLIRNDVEQPAQNSYLFHTFWKPKTQSKNDRFVDGFSFSQMMWLAKQAGLENGKEYQNFNEFLKDFIGKCLGVTMEYDEWKGKKQERIVELFPTAHPECKHKYRDKQSVDIPYAPPQDKGFAIGAAQTDATDIDEDFPF